MCYVHGFKNQAEAKPVLPPIPGFGQFSPVLGIFIRLDWCLVPGRTGRSSLVFKTMVICHCCGEIVDHLLLHCEQAYLLVVELCF